MLIWTGLAGEEVIGEALGAPDDAGGVNDIVVALSHQTGCAGPEVVLHPKSVPCLLVPIGLESDVVVDEGNIIHAGLAEGSPYSAIGTSGKTEIVPK